MSFEIENKLKDWWKAPNKDIWVKFVKASCSNGGKVKFVIWKTEKGFKAKMENAHGFYPNSPAVYKQALANLLGITKKEVEEMLY